MYTRRLCAATVLILVAGTAILGAAPALGAAEQPTKRLRAFASCEALVRYGQRHVEKVEQQGSQTPVESPAGSPLASEPQAQSGFSAPRSDTSQTNVQEAGVDEPDTVKTDGDRIFALDEGRLHAVEARDGPLRLLGSIAVDGYGQQLLLRGNTVLVISSGAHPPATTQTPADTSVMGESTTLLTEIDVTRPEAMRVVRKEWVEGDFVDARMHDGTARFVISSTPPGVYEDDAELRPRLEGWMPYFQLEDFEAKRTSVRRAASCRAVRKPPVFSGLSVVMVLTVDLDRGLPAVDAEAVMTDAETVYASADNLYVATERWFPDAGSQDQLPPRSTTAIHRFDISDPDVTTYRGSGQVPGYLLNQFSLSEHRGFLRVATTDEPPDWDGEERPGSENVLTVLEPRVGGLAEVGRLGGLGAGEFIQAVRFMGDAGFLATSNEDDPLYSLDLSDPTRPGLAGQLRIRGSSAYLHPVGEDLLLGVGQDLSEEDGGGDSGTLLSLFDISDLRHPIRLQAHKVASFSYSDVEYDHHAFLYWAPTRLAVLPIALDTPRSQSPFFGAFGFRVARTGGIGRVGHVTHYQGRGSVAISRSLVVAGRLFTLSEVGLKASDLSDLHQLAWVPFPPRPPEPPSSGPLPAVGARADRHRP